MYVHTDVIVILPWHAIYWRQLSCIYTLTWDCYTYSSLSFDWWIEINKRTYRHLYFSVPNGQRFWGSRLKFMMTSWHGIIFHISGPSWEESTGQRWNYCNVLCNTPNGTNSCTIQIVYSWTAILDKCAVPVPSTGFDTCVIYTHWNELIVSSGWHIFALKILWNILEQPMLIVAGCVVKKWRNYIWIPQLFLFYFVGKSGHHIVMRHGSLI